MAQFVKVKVSGEELNLLLVGHAEQWLAGRKAARPISRQAIHKAIRTGRLRAYRTVAVKGKRATTLVDPDELLAFVNESS